MLLPEMCLVFGKVYISLQEWILGNEVCVLDYRCLLPIDIVQISLLCVPGVDLTACMNTGKLTLNYDADLTGPPVWAPRGQKGDPPKLLGVCTVIPGPMAPSE